MTYKKNIPDPNPEEVEKMLQEWRSLQDYFLQEQALCKLFSGEFKSNDDLINVLLKCSTLNDFYSTNIFKIFPVAEHIYKLHIDEDLYANEESLVNRIANVTIIGKNGFPYNKNFYSFASKYCSHHNPENYPIYDSYIAKTLKYFRAKNKDFKFRNEDLLDYPSFKKILKNFEMIYGITKYDFKELDHYLWMIGKENFPINYGTVGKYGK